MNTEVKKLTPEEKHERTMKLRAHHKAVLDKIDYDVVYRPKLCYTPKGKDTKHISFFVSELKLGKDIYTEFISSEYESEDPKRTLWKWKYDPEWDKNYEPVKKGNVIERYLVPVSDLVFVSSNDKPAEVDFELNDPETDLPVDQLTVRDLFAIFHKVPVSRKKFLNELITKIK